MRAWHTGGLVSGGPIMAELPVPSENSIRHRGKNLRQGRRRIVSRQLESPVLSEPATSGRANDGLVAAAGSFPFDDTKGVKPIKIGGRVVTAPALMVLCCLNACKGIAPPGAPEGPWTNRPYGPCGVPSMGSFPVPGMGYTPPPFIGPPFIILNPRPTPGMWF